MRWASTLICLGLATAANAGVTLSVNVRNAQVKEVFYLTVRAEGTQIGTPVMPHAPGLVINRSPSQNSTSTSVQFINGKVQQTSAQEWVYQAWATQAGNLEIPPVKVSIGGKDELSNPVAILIQDGGTAPGAQPSPEPRQQQPRRGRSQRSQAQRAADISTDQIMLLESKASKEKVYQGEAISYEVTFLVLNEPGVRVSGVEGNQLNIPPADGFYESEIVMDEKMETRDGLNYIARVFRRTMFATRTGTLEIPAIQWSGRATAPTQIGPRTFAIDRQTQPITIEVKALPDRPANFSGAVGRFNIRGEIEGGVVEQGVPKVYTVTIAGEGNVDAVPKPVLPAMDWAHASEPEVSTTQLAGPLEFEKKFAYTLTPMQADLHQIPGVDFVFFAPEIGNYKTISTKPLDVFVQPSKDTGQLVVAGGQSAAGTADVQVLGADIAPIMLSASTLAPARSALPVHLLGFGAPPAVFFAALSLIRRRRRLATDVGYARGLRASSRSRKRLHDASRSKDPAEAIFRALSGFVGDKLNLPDAGMTSHDVRDAMLRNGFPEALVQEYTSVLRACERQRYSGQALSQKEAEALHDAAAQALEHLESEAGARQ